MELPKVNYGTTREDVLTHIKKECLIEMYAKAQPSYDLRAYFAECEKHRSEPGWHHPDDDPKMPLYLKHYLSEAEFKYIRQKYIDTFKLNERWKSNVNLLLENLKNGGYIDVYVKDENDVGHRDNEKQKSLNDLIGDYAANIVYTLIEGYRDWYRFDREESSFSVAISLGGSPCSSAKTVKEYWAKQGIELEIEERDPELFWYKDNGWTDEEISEEFNWKNEEEHS